MRLDEFQHLRRRIDEGGPERFLLGGIASEYADVIRPGDVITSVMKGTDIYQRSGRLGEMLFYITEERWTNQRGGLVKTTSSTNILW